MRILRDKYASLSLAGAKKDLIRLRRIFYEFGNKPGIGLARALRTQQGRSFIPQIKKEDNQKAITSKEIAETFMRYHEALYNIAGPKGEGERTKRQRDIEEYLASSGMPKISKTQEIALEAPISLEEFSIALASTPSGKAPGPDGFTAAYYKTYKELLGGYFMSAFGEMAMGGVLSPDILKAFISVIPKEGKDHLNCGSYRPISLLNADVKKYAKILANRLVQVAQKYRLLKI